MEASRKRHGTKPRVAGTLAGAFAFGIGAAALVYFVELRGAGFATELTGPRALEIAAFAGAVGLLALVASWSVTAMARRAADDTELQELLHRAHVLDVTDPEALLAFDSVPPLRDVVAQLVTEKAHTRELSDRVESVRGELNAIVEGMRRSAKDLVHLREENLGAPAMQIVVLWNGLVDRIVRAEAARDAAREAAREAAAAAGQVVPVEGAPSDVGMLVARLDELESELGRLRTAVSNAEPAVAALEEPASWNAGSPALAPEAPPARWTESETVTLDEPVAAWELPDAYRLPEEAPTIPAQDAEFIGGTFGHEEGFAQVAAEPEFDSREGRRAADPFAPGSLLPDEFGPAGVVPAAPAPQRAADAAPATPFAAPPPPELEGMRFPEFIGGPRRRPPDKVDLTYETQTGDDVSELPASALLFDPEDTAPAEDGVFDLRSFEATEFDK